MLLYITGGAGSGKSAFAEDQILRSPAAPRLYVASMEPSGPEAEARIARHRALRAGKGFETVERPRALETLPVPAGCAVLLEDLTNLFANEWFGPAREGAAGCDRVLETLHQVMMEGLPSGLKPAELKWEEAAWDQDASMFLRRGSLRCGAYFIAAASEDGPLLEDFILKGVMK